MTQELAESIKRLCTECKQLGQYESLKTINALVQLVGEMVWNIEHLQSEMNAQAKQAIYENSLSAQRNLFNVSQMNKQAQKALTKSAPIAALATLGITVEGA